MPRHPLIDTCEQILRDQLPNFLRLYLNPFVTQTCFCLTRYVQTTWSAQATRNGEYQTFLANGFDEALGGAIKLARYCASVAGQPTTGLILDPDDRLGPFASVSLTGGEKVAFLPGVAVVGKGDDLTAAASAGPFGLMVLAGVPEDRSVDAIRRLIQRDAPLVITCMDCEALTALRRDGPGLVRELAPDIVVFDESFVDRAVPFSAFTARQVTL